MSKNIQNKNYYEIGVFSLYDTSPIHTYTTRLPITIGDGIIYNEIMDFLYKEHNKDIIVLWNEKHGELPNNIDEIKIEIPDQQKIKYNR